MRSKASIKGHPIHVMLIPFPIAFFVGTLVADIVTLSTLSPFWFFVGYVLNIGAFSMAAIAAIPGLIDYFNIIPARSRARKHATRHMGLNLTIAALYFVSWLIKENMGGLNFVPVALEVIGTGMLLYSGWLGWTLVYKHGVAIDERETRAYDEERAA